MRNEFRLEGKSPAGKAGMFDAHNPTAFVDAGSFRFFPDPPIMNSRGLGDQFDEYNGMYAIPVEQRPCIGGDGARDCLLIIHCDDVIDQQHPAPVGQQVSGS